MSRYLTHSVGSMMKEGVRIHDEPVLKNIEAVKDLSKITRSSLGPDGLNKMVINHLGKLFVTHDASTIIRELDVEHPAAKLVALAVKAMEEEVGDGTNLVLILAGELLNQADQLIRIGIHPAFIIPGFEKASEAALEMLPELIVKTVDDLRNVEMVKVALRTAIVSKQPAYADHLAAMVAEACVNVCPTNAANFNVDCVRVSKLEGGNVRESKLIHGFVIARGAEGAIKEAHQAKVAIYNCAIDNASTDTKGKVDITSADQLKTFSKSEENSMEKVIEAIAKSGVKVVVSTQNFGDLALHFLEQHGIMAAKVSSKFEVQRLAKAVNAQAMMTLDPPTPEELGRCDHVRVDDVGGRKILIFQQENESSRLATLIIRGATANVLDDVERAIDDGVNCYKALTKNGGLVAGGGACEMELSRRLMAAAEKVPEMHQYAMRKFAQSFEIIPTSLAEISGHNATTIITSLTADHQNGDASHGVDIEAGTTSDMVAAGVLDAYSTKFWAIKFATEAAITVLKVDQIIMSKPAGGPKPDRRPGGDGDDDE